MNNIKKNIADISKIIKDKLIELNDTLIKRNRKITVTDLFYLLCNKTYSGYSYASSISHMRLNGFLSEDISVTSFSNKRKLLQKSDIENINKELIQYIYKDKKSRILAVDASYIQLDGKFQKYGFRLNNKEHYCTGSISSVYDIENNITINYTLGKTTDERELFLKQLDYLKTDDIVVFDRGYFSLNLAEILFNRGIKFVFRLKKNVNMVKHLIKNNIDEYKTFIKNKGKRIPVRCVRYKIEKQFNDNYHRPEDGYYYMCTNLTKNKYKINEIKKIYNDRWSIETNFKVSKYNLNLDSLPSKNLVNIEQDITVHNFILLLSGYLRSLVSNNIKKNCKVNFTNFLIQLCKNIHLLLYNKVHYKQINKLYNIIIYLSKIIYINEIGRHYKRIRKKPSTKWGPYGNIYAHK